MKYLTPVLLISILSCSEAKDPLENETTSQSVQTSISSSTLTTKEEQPSMPNHTDQELMEKHVNELGQIMVLEYHRIDSPAKNDWIRTPEGFRDDLELLYRKGFVPISMADFIDGRFDVPLGKSPVLLTLDDSSDTQFRYIKDDVDEWKIDPNCAIGIMLAFRDRHPDFPLRGIFYALPGASKPNNLFGQPELNQMKIDNLLKWGFEIGNHTLWHANLKKYEAETEKHLALHIKAMRQYIPDYSPRSLALPYGVYPNKVDRAVKGEYEGISYHHETLMEVSGGPSHSPFDKRYDPKHVNRIVVMEGIVERWITRFQKGTRTAFISDGDPNTLTIPASAKDNLAKRLPKQVKVRTITN